MVKIVGSVHLGDGILKVKPNKPFFGSNGLEIFFVQDDWVKIELAPTPLGCYYLVDFTTDPTDTSFNPTEKWRVPQHDCSLAQVRGLESDSEKYQSEIQQLKEALQQRSHLHQEQSGKYQTEIQQLTQENNKLKSSAYSADKLRTEGRTELLRSFNFLQSSIPQSANYTRNSTEIDSIVNSLRQKLADKEQQISTLQSQVNSSSQVIESLQQRSHSNPRELEELKAKYNQVVQDLEQVNNASQQKSDLHQQELAGLKQKLQEQQLDYEQKIQAIKSGKLEQSENRTDLLRAFNSVPTGDRTVSQPNSEQASALNELRQKLAHKEQQINVLQSKVNNSSQIIEQLQQRSQLQQEQSGKYQIEIQQLQEVVEDRLLLTSRLKELEVKYLQSVEETKKVNSELQQKTYLHQVEVDALKQQIEDQESQYGELAMQIQQALIDNQDKVKANETESNTSLNIIKRFL